MNQEYAIDLSGMCALVECRIRVLNIHQMHAVPSKVKTVCSIFTIYLANLSSCSH